MDLFRKMADKAIEAKGLFDEHRRATKESTFAQTEQRLGALQSQLSAKETQLADKERALNEEELRLRNTSRRPAYVFVFCTITYATITGLVLNRYDLQARTKSSPAVTSGYAEQKSHQHESVEPQGETPIPRSVPGDNGRYFLLESKRIGDVVHALHKRISVDSVDFTRTETNCTTRQMQEVGTGEGSVQKIRISPTKWFDLVPGSSKSDLAQFVCKW